MSSLLPDPPSWLDLYNQAKAELLLKRPELNALPGDISDMLMAGGAAAGDLLGTYAQDRFAATYVDGANGDDLDQRIMDEISLPRFQANPSTGTLYFSRLVGGVAGTITANTIVATAPDFNGVSYQFSTDVDLTFGISGLDGYVTATSVISESESNVAANTIIQSVTTLFDTSISVTNQANFAGGTDGESDVDYRNRSRNFYQTLQRGTSAALQFGALEVNGVGIANVVEEIDPTGALNYQGNPLLTGITNVFVSDSSGNSSDTMISDVIANEELYRGAGQVINVYGASFIDLLTELGSVLQIVVTLRISSGITAASIQQNIVSAVVARINRLNIGDTLTSDMVKQAVLNVDMDNILAVALQYTVGGNTFTFAGIIVANNQVVRTTTSEITVIQSS